ncbi:MAG: sugar transferase [Candidatus Hinthialibacter sp.]
MPRFLEFFIALIALTLLLPVFLVISMAICLDSRGWPFFRQRRVGRGGAIFWMFKFRKMFSYVPPDGKGITTNHDVRLTRMGRLLERFKLDELPQIINVLLGDIALVGPRPEIERFISYYPEKWEKVLSIRPGLIGYSQIKVPHEGDLYPKNCLDHEKYYIEHILPEKLENEIEYMEKKSLWLDLSILFKVSLSLLSRTITLRWLIVHLSPFFVLLVDMVLSCISVIASFALVFQLGVPENYYSIVKEVILYSIIIRPIFFVFFGLPKYPISSSITSKYVVTILKSCFYSSLIMIMALMFIDKRDLVLSAHLVDAFFLPTLLLITRFAYISLHDSLLATDSFRSPLRILSHLLILLLNGFLGFLSFWLCHIIRLQELNINNLIPKIGFISVIVFFIRTGLSITIWPPRAKGWGGFCKREIPRIFQTSLIGTGLILISYLILQKPAYSRMSLISDTLLYAGFVSILSLIWCMPLIRLNQLQRTKKTIVLGIGIETELFLSTIDRLNDDHIEIVGIVTDIEWKRFSSIAGYRVIGTIGDLESLFEVHHPRLLIAWEWAKDKDYWPYVKSVCQKRGVEYCINPSLNSLLAKEQEDFSPDKNIAV